MKDKPCLDQWLMEAKADSSAPLCGMYLTHNGVVRETARKLVREGVDDTKPVSGMNFSYEKALVDKAVDNTYKMDGIHYVRVWLNDGELNLGDDIMFVLIGGDIRPHVVDALQYLVGEIKSNCVVEEEIF